MQSTLHELSITDRSIAFFVFGFLLACYLLTYTGVIQSSDGLAMFATAESIVRRGEVDSNQLVWMGTQQGNFGPDGDLYSRKGLGMTLLALPLVWLARLWPAVGLVQTALLLNPILTAWTGALVFRTGRRLGWDRNAAVFAALLFGLATLAWPYTQSFFSDPVCAFGLFAAFYGLLSYSQSHKKRYLLIGGLAWGIAYLARVINLMTLPIYLVGLVIAVLYASRLAGRTLPLAGKLRLVAKREWRPLITFMIPVVMAGLISLWWNWVRYGSIWDSGYAETERFDAVWWFGVGGLLFGPARGLIWYSPVLLLAIPGAVWFWRHARFVLGFCLAISLVYIAVYGKWYMWHGGYSWGPRFLVPLMPFLALLTGPAWDQWVLKRRYGFAGRFAGIALAIISVCIQWLGMLVPFGMVQNWLDANVQPLFAPETFVRLEYSPLVLQWQFLNSRNIHLFWWRGDAGMASVNWFGLIMPLAALVVGLVILVRRVNSATTSDTLASTRSEWLYGGALGFIALAVLTYVYTILNEPEMRQVAQRIAQMEQSDDAIVHLLPEHSQEFANVYHGRLPTYGLVPQGQLGDAEREQLANLERTYPRLWVVPDSALPEQSGWERTLRTDDFLLFDTRMSEPNGQRLSLYALTAAQSLIETGLGTVFGDPALVEAGIDADNGWIRLDGYAMTQETHPGGDLLLALRWESLRPVTEDYQVFVHLLNAAGDKLAQRDGQPVQWLRPTTSWQQGERIIDRYGLLLSSDLPVGVYSVAVGLYDPITGQRLPVSAGPRDYAIELGPVQVTSRD